MRIIAFVEDPKAIDRIIGHLKLRFQAEWPPLPQSDQHELLMEAEERGEYFLGPLWLFFIDLEGKAYLKAECGTVFGELLRFCGQ